MRGYDRYTFRRLARRDFGRAQNLAYAVYVVSSEYDLVSACGRIAHLYGIVFDLQDSDGSFGCVYFPVGVYSEHGFFPVCVVGSRPEGHIVFLQAAHAGRHVAFSIFQQHHIGHYQTAFHLGTSVFHSLLEVLCRFDGFVYRVVDQVRHVAAYCIIIGEYFSGLGAGYLGCRTHIGQQGREIIFECLEIDRK